MFTSITNILFTLAVTSTIVTQTLPDEDWFARPHYQYFISEDAIDEKKNSGFLPPDSNIETVSLVYNQTALICKIPKVSGDVESAEFVEGYINDGSESVESYLNQVRHNALMKLQTMPCVHLLTGYWTYEFCPFRSLRQFHKPDPKNPFAPKPSFWRYSDVMEYTLASYKKLASSSMQLQVHHETKTWFIREIWKGGTVCDLNGEARSSVIEYFCSPTGREEIAFVRETATCQYKAVIHTPRLCLDPLFRSKHIGGSPSIYCYPEFQHHTLPADEASRQQERHVWLKTTDKIKIMDGKDVQVDPNAGPARPGGKEKEQVRQRGQSEGHFSALQQVLENIGFTGDGQIHEPLVIDLGHLDQLLGKIQVGGQNNQEGLDDEQIEAVQAEIREFAARYTNRGEQQPPNNPNNQPGQNEQYQQDGQDEQEYQEEMEFRAQ